MPSNSKRLTKEQKFNLEMVYKPLYREKIGTKLEGDDIKSIKEISKYLDIVFDRNVDKIFSFLDLYKNQVIWLNILNSNGFYRNILLDFALRYKDYLNQRCWEYLSLNIFNNSEDFIRKFKDKLDWEILTKRYKFSKEFFIEMNDYIKKSSSLKSESVTPVELRTELSKYLKEENCKKETR